MNTPQRLALLLAFAVSALADDYPRQPGIDAQHYQFRVTLSDDTDEIAGDTTVDLRFVQPGVTRVFLDLADPHDGKGMTVTEVTTAGRTLPSPARPTACPSNFPMRPNPARCGASPCATAVSLPADCISEPTASATAPSSVGTGPTFARQWLPVIDHPSDKATSEFEVTAPSRYQVVANGALVETRDLGGGHRLTHWKESVPVASWLNNIGVAEFVRGRSIPCAACRSRPGSSPGPRTRHGYLRSTHAPGARLLH